MLKRIMIVDDEVLVRIGIKSMAAWEKHGYTIVCDASDGEEAMEKIRQYQPHIVLTDLKMKPMDGFELIQRCAREFPQIKFIVLSNYNDFDNVRRAMKLGAFDYVFKLTVHGDELLKLLNEASADFKEHEVRKNENSKDVLFKNRDVIKNGLFKQAMNKEDLFLDKVSRSFQNIALKIDFNSNYSVLSIQIDNLDIVKKKGDFLEKDLLLFSMGNIIEELMERGCRTEVFQYQDYEFEVVINREEQQTQEDFFTMLELRFQMVVKYVRQYYGFGISGAVSREGTGIEYLRTAAGQNEKMLKRRFFLESGNLLFYEEAAPEEVKLPADLEISVLKTALLQGDFYGAGEYIEKLLAYLEENKNGNPDGIRLCLCNLCRKLNVLLPRHGVETADITDKNGLSLEEAVGSYTFYREIKESLWEQWELCLDSCGMRARRPCRKEISEVKSYVRKFLGEEITVSKCAAMCSMSDSRFSHVFKAETGVSFIEFVNAARMEKARELLQNTDLRINEIAEQIGIFNPNYFSAQYKKKTGLSPNEFRKSLHQQNMKEKQQNMKGVLKDTF